MADTNSRQCPPPNRRRDKIQLSCGPCRRRKLKCDRQQPCGACLRRGHTSSCTYVTRHLSTSDAQQPTLPQRPTSLHDRISGLESLVMTLIKGHLLPTPPVLETPRPSPLSISDGFSKVQTPDAARSQDVHTADPGTLYISESGVSYVQSVHWEAILAQIKGLKENLATDVKPVTGSHLFYGPSRHATREEILAAIPDRPSVDCLMALHFDSYLITPYLIHSQKFLREYESFWKDPSAASVAWIGLLFSMLCVAAQLQIFAIDVADERIESRKAECLAMKDVFRDKALQCLMLAKYTLGGPYILETLIMVLTGESLLMRDSTGDGWLSISMVLHLAIRMGYHRDPDHFPGISVYDSEMRRRIWTTILVLDVALSLGTGLPRSVTDAHSDTKLPLNLHDSDIDENTCEIPTSRPETQWTSILPLIAKGRLISVLGRICNINTNIESASYEDVVKVDALLEDMHNHEIPSILRWGTLPHPITDSPALVVHRISMETSYNKSRILLHRGALIRNPSRNCGVYDSESVRICLSSALEILAFQRILHEESQPLGRLYQLRWKVNHIFNQDVLLATSILCFYLQDVDRLAIPETLGQPALAPTEEEIRERLMVSRGIWLQIGSTSVEAVKVAKALSIVLGSAESNASTAYDLSTNSDAILPNNEFGSAFDNQYFLYGFYSPLTFFDNVLETHGA